MWYTIKNYSKYEIDENGNIRNKRTLHVLKRQRNSKVFAYTLIGDDEKMHSEYIHRLLAVTFIENPNGYKYVEFKDGNPYNLSLNNLYWTLERKHSRRKNTSMIEKTLWYKERCDKINNLYKEIHTLEEELENIYSEWVTIKGFPLYEINRRGELRKKSTKKLVNPVLGHQGYYLNVILNEKKEKKLVCIHRLVALQFIPNPNNLKIVNHIDENKLNNDVLNLEWVSHKQNSNHGTSPHRIAQKHSIPVNEYDSKGKYIRTWKSIKAFADYYGIDRSSVSAHIRLGKGFCVGRIVKQYEGIRKDLSFEEVKKRGEIKCIRKRVDNNKEILEDSLYIEDRNENNMENIFDYYDSFVRVDYKKLRNDIQQIYDEIKNLEMEINLYDR